MSFRSSAPVRLRDQDRETGSIPGSSTEKVLVRGSKPLASFHLINISSTFAGYAADMASLRSGTRRDGTTYVQVLYQAFRSEASG